MGLQHVFPQLIKHDRKLEQAFTVKCFDDIVVLMPLLAPAAS